MVPETRQHGKKRVLVGSRGNEGDLPRFRIQFRRDIFAHADRYDRRRFGFQRGPRNG